MKQLLISLVSLILFINSEGQNRYYPYYIESYMKVLDRGIYAGFEKFDGRRSIDCPFLFNGQFEQEETVGYYQNGELKKLIFTGVSGDSIYQLMYYFKEGELLGVIELEKVIESPENLDLGIDIKELFKNTYYIFRDNLFKKKTVGQRKFTKFDDFNLKTLNENILRLIQKLEEAKALKYNREMASANIAFTPLGLDEQTSTATNTIVR